MTLLTDEPSLRRLALLVLAPVGFVAAVVAAVLAFTASATVGNPPDGPPLDLSTVTSEVAAHYHAAAQLADTYQQVPCYCGCEEFLAHRNLYDCFVRADGAGWEAHAAGCGVCIAESVTVRDLVATDTDTATIARTVIDRFGTTPTTSPPPT